MKKIILLTNQILIPLNRKNKNNRIYVNNKKLRKAIKKYNNYSQINKFGEIGMKPPFETNLKNISHKTENVRIEKDNIIGDITILNTNSGTFLKNNIKSFVFRPKLVGKVLKNGKVVIYNIVAFNAINILDDSF